MSQAKLRVTKIDAARRQLETAIRLWLASEDPVSVHTLAAAAHQVLHDLGAKSATPSIMRGLDVIRPEHRKRILRAICKPENFMKHADRDPQDVLTFSPAFTEMLLLDAVLTYDALTRNKVPTLNAFQIWMFLNNPEILDEDYKKKLLETEPTSVTVARGLSKQEFFKIWMCLLRQPKVDKAPV